jgi:hypothetical protein
MMFDRVFSDAVCGEISSAQKQHPPLNSLHEAIAVIHEEYLEAQTEVYKKVPDLLNLRKELIQLAAMCGRTVIELVDPKLNKKYLEEDRARMVVV